MVDVDVKVRPDALCDVILRLSHGGRGGCCECTLREGGR